MWVTVGRYNTSDKEKKLEYEINIFIFFTLVSQDTKTPAQEESAAAEILAPVLKAPTETPAPSPAEAGINLGASQGRQPNVPAGCLVGVIELGGKESNTMCEML